jgi:hypothetical protein
VVVIFKVVASGTILLVGRRKKAMGLSPCMIATAGAKAQID